MPEWRMLVWEPDGTARATINVDGPVARLDRFDVNGAGNCLEASWVADPQSVTIKARDVIRLDAREDSGDAWTSVYKGFVTIAGSSRAESLQDYRAVGLKQRFYEILLEEGVIDGADVATMVDSAMSSITLPEGVTYSSSDVPTLNFELGDRYPALETVGDFLDALADTVGRFIVPTGSSYTYDGVTYDPGDIVPAVKWGTKADGSFFFARPQAASVSVSEGATGTLVRWERASGEEVYDNVTFIYASEYGGQEAKITRLTGASGGTAETLPEPVAHPIARNFGTGNYEATRRVTLPNPIDFMQDEASSTIDIGDVLNPSNAFDGDDATFAEFNSGGCNLTGYCESPEAIVRVVIQKANNTEHLELTVGYEDASGNTIATRFFDLTTLETDDKLTLIVPSPTPAEAVSLTPTRLWSRLVSDAAAGCKIFSLERYVPDVDVGGSVSENAADGYEIEPVDNASEVELVNQLGGVSQTMSLTPTGESVEDVDIERIETSLTTDRGLITRYLLAQSFDAELLSQRVVLERLVRNAQS